MNIFQTAIKKGLKNKGMTQKMLCRKVGFKDQNFSKYMTGARKTIPVSVLESILIELEIELIVKNQS